MLFSEKKEPDVFLKTTGKLFKNIMMLSEKVKKMSGFEVFSFWIDRI